MNLADELRKLAELREAGHLTDQEFADAKGRLLGEPRAEPPEGLNKATGDDWQYTENGWVHTGRRITPPPIPKEKQTVPSRVSPPTKTQSRAVIFGLLLVLVILIGTRCNRSDSQSSSSASQSNTAASTPSTASATSVATPPATSGDGSWNKLLTELKDRQRQGNPEKPDQTPELKAIPTPAPTATGLSAKDQAFVDSGGHWITDDTWAARSKEDLKELIKMALSDDIHAQAQMVREGRAVLLKQGQRVQLQEVAMFSGMEKVRLVGETNGWWIDLSRSSDTPVMTHEEKLSAVQTTTQGIAQKPLTGALSSVKLFLGQPLTTWKKAYPSAKPTLLNPNAYNFNAGRFVITVFFDENSGLPKQLSIAEAERKAPMTVKEATQIADSIGLKKPVKDAEDPSFLNWNNEGDPLFAFFNKDDPGLSIEVKP